MQLDEDSKEIAIQQMLSRIEDEHNVHILYACESGSRAWGFPSPNSDYDVRFLYVRPQSAYLRLDVPRDVIEMPVVDDLDVNGWDIFKALRLLRKSNPPLLEWLSSPIMYRETSSSIEAIRTISRQYFSPSSIHYHYKHMANGNYNQYLRGKDNVILKKYLYVLRPLVVLLYLEQRQKLPPINFIQTLASIGIANDVFAHILQLIEKKQSGDELGIGPADPVLHAWIDQQMAREIDVPEYDAKKREKLSHALEEVLASILREEKQP